MEVCIAAVAVAILAAAYCNSCRRIGRFFPASFQLLLAFFPASFPHLFRSSACMPRNRTASLQAACAIDGIACRHCDPFAKVCIATGNLLRPQTREIAVTVEFIRCFVIRSIKREGAEPASYAAPWQSPRRTLSRVIPMV
jgi:hypothetical protein